MALPVAIGVKLLDFATAGDIPRSAWPPGLVLPAFAVYAMALWAVLRKRIHHRDKTPSLLLVALGVVLAATISAMAAMLALASGHLIGHLPLRLMMLPVPLPLIVFAVTWSALVWLLLRCKILSLGKTTEGLCFASCFFVWLAYFSVSEKMPCIMAGCEETRAAEWHKFMPDKYTPEDIIKSCDFIPLQIGEVRKISIRDVQGESFFGGKATIMIGVEGERKNGNFYFSWQWGLHSGETFYCPCGWQIEDGPITAVAFDESGHHSTLAEKRIYKHQVY